MKRHPLDIYIDVLRLCMKPSGVTMIIKKCRLNSEIVYRYINELLKIKVLIKIEDRHIIDNIKSRGTKPIRLYVTNWKGENVIRLYNEINLLFNSDVDIEAEKNIKWDVLNG